MIYSCKLHSEFNFPPFIFIFSSQHTEYHLHSRVERNDYTSDWSCSRDGCPLSHLTPVFFYFILLLLFTHPEWKWFYWVIQRISSVLSAKCRRNWNKQKTMVDRGVIHESEGVEEQSHMVWMGQEFAGERMKSLSELHAIFFALKISSSKILHLLKPL